MDTQVQKVYVAVSNDVQEGLSSLEWALKNWSSQLISIVILHVDTSCKNFVYTPFGKMPSSSVSDEKLEVFRMFEQEKVDKLLSNYMAFCGKVRTEIHKIEHSEEPIHNVVIGLIIRLKITKLVMGITFMKPSSGKTKSSIGGSFRVERLKPDYCELFLICGGKLVFLRQDNDERYLEDDQGVLVANMRKVSFKGWLSRILSDTTDHDNEHAGPSNARDRQMKCRDEIENYLQILVMSKFNDGDNEEENIASTMSLIETDLSANTSHDIETMKGKIEEAKTKIEKKRKEAEANIDRQKRAECIISLCKEGVDELQGCIEKELADQVNLQKDLDSTREQINKIASEVEENKNKLNSVIELQSELATVLHHESSAVPLAEVELEQAVIMRADMLSDIEKLRGQIEVLHGRIVFCKERDTIGSATTSMDTRLNYREFTENEIRAATENEIRAATDNFVECMELESQSEFSAVYKGRLQNMTVAIQMQTLYDEQQLHAKMELLCKIRHPNIVSTIGACFDPRCIVFEYMHNGSLQEFFSSDKYTRARGRKNQNLSWYTRMKITTQICSGLGFLHSAEPRPIVHNNLNPSNILLDNNLVAKLTNMNLTSYYNDSYLRSDICDFGFLMLLLLTGRDDGEVIAGVMKAMECGTIVEVLDNVARDWPLELAKEFACIAMRCIAVENLELRISTVMLELEELSEKAAEIMRRGGGETVEVDEENECFDVPNIFMCPIFQEVMSNPHVAADGFSYELEAIQEWLKTGTTSPMTNLTLKHTILTPNHTLRALIHDWQMREH